METYRPSSGGLLVPTAAFRELYPEPIQQAALQDGPMPPGTRRPVGDGLENILAGLGTGRDKASYTGWTFPRLLTRQDLENMYRVSWLAKRIVNAPADDMTREWRAHSFDDGRGTENRRMEQAEKWFGVRHKVNEALRWARLYGGSLIIVGTADTQAQPRRMAEPLEIDRIPRGGLRYLMVADRWRCPSSGKIEADPASPHFGMPESYLLADTGYEIHHSRVVRFDGERLPWSSWRQNALWHDSALQHVLDALKGCDTTVAAIATMMFEANVDILKLSSLDAKLSRKDGEALLHKRFRMAATMKSFNHLFMLDETETYEKKSNSFANLDKIMQEFYAYVAGAAGIPLTRLFGRSPGGLNATGDSDLENYYTRIASDQETELRPRLETLDAILYRHELGAIPDDAGFEFNSLWELTDKEQAEVEEKRANRDRAYVDMGAVTPGLVARELKDRGTYRAMTDDDLLDAEEGPDEEGDTGSEGQQTGDAALALRPTRAMAEEAKRGLAWRRKHGRGGTAIGIARARDIARRRNLSPETVRRMHSFFARHEPDTRAEGFRPSEGGYPSHGRIAWALWGGDAGKAWADRMMARLDKRDD